MIKNYNLHNFKIHDNTNLELGRITLLTGVNGMGKSSVIQSMLMLRESFIKRDLPDNLNLRGDSFYVGMSSSIVNWNPTDDAKHLVIEFTATDDDEKNVDKCRFSFNYLAPDKTYLESNPDDTSYDVARLKSISLFNKDFQYLSAFRYGPMEDYQSDEIYVDQNRQISKSRGRGEYGIYFLEKFGSENIPIPQLNYNPETETDLSLKRQVELWMNEIAEGTSLKIDQTGNQYKLKLAFRRQGKSPFWVDALNTGFGISYTLSLLTAILSSKPGALILLENPEAHIHPAAQAGLMRLISLAAAYGVQFIIETHSDHIVNGALVGLKREILPADSVSIYFFERDSDSYNALPTKMEITEECRITNGPDGFFTQLQSDMEVLFGFRN